MAFFSVELPESVFVFKLLSLVSFNFFQLHVHLRD